MAKKKHKKLKISGLIILILFLYLLGAFIHKLYISPLKKINISGNTYIKDNYIINYLDIENESIFKINSKKIRKKLLELDLISDAKIKKNYLGYLNIKIIEDKVLFYNWNNKKIVMSSGKEVDYNSNYLGFPTLINYVPKENYDEFVNKFKRVNKDIVTLISEIEYSPSRVNDKIVDENRYLFRMNDGNQVYINTINIEKINNYIDIYEAVRKSTNGEVNGCLYLDSNSKNKHFGSCDDKKVEENTDESEL